MLSSIRDCNAVRQVHGLSLAGEPKLVGRKEVIRKRTIEELTMRSKTTFEFWWVGLETPAK